MIRHRFTVRLALAALALVMSTMPAQAGEQVPFKGTLEGDQTRTPLDPPFVLDEFDMSGQATQLGDFDLLITAVVNTTTRTASGKYEFVAANGDKLKAVFEGSSMPTATPGVILITETAVIDPSGCTGRFAGASGSFVCMRLFDTLTGETFGSFEGTISSPGASKK